MKFLDVSLPKYHLLFVSLNKWMSEDQKVNKKKLILWLNPNKKSCLLQTFENFRYIFLHLLFCAIYITAAHARTDWNQITSLFPLMHILSKHLNLYGYTALSNMTQWTTSSTPIHENQIYYQQEDAAVKGALIVFGLTFSATAAACC